MLEHVKGVTQLKIVINSLTKYMYLPFQPTL